MKQINNPHDRAFRAAMANKKVAIEFLKQHLPKKLQRAMEFSSIRLCPETYIDEALQLTASDVLFTIQLRGQPAYLYLLAEHQSKPDKKMPLRIIQYSCAIMERHGQQHPGGGLPLVIPLVFYNGRSRYRYSCDIKDLILAPRELIDTVLFKPFILIDSHNLVDEELKRHHWSGLLQFLFKHIYARNIIKRLEASKELWVQIDKEGGVDYILMLGHYLLAAVGSQHQKKMIDLLVTNLSEGTGEKMLTIAEALKQQGFQAGMQQGEAKGEAAILLRQLKRKFGEIPRHYIQRIEQANAEQLLLLCERILDARSIKEVFGE